MPACQWCQRRPAKRGAKYCSHSCRQRAYESRLQAEQILVALERAIRHAATITAMLRIHLTDRHIVSPRIQGETENER